MAALTPTLTTEWASPPATGQYKVVTYNVTVASQSATDEWIATGGSEVLAVVGFCNSGTSGTGGVSIVKNASGTGSTAGANPGNLGIETVLAADQVIDITVMYR